MALLVTIAAGAGAIPRDPLASATLRALEQPGGSAWRIRTESSSARSQHDLGAKLPQLSERSTHAALPRLFYLGTQKGGSSSFANFVHRSLNYSAVYHSAPAAYAALGFNQSDCSAPASGDGTLPNYEAWQRELTTVPGQLERALASDVQVFADTPWYQIFPYIERHVPDAKFVIWERETESWVKSFYAYYCEDTGGPSEEFPGGFRAAAGWREALLLYGHARPCEHGFAAVQADLRRSYDTHLRSVRAYFSETADRAARILYLDMMADDAGRTLCEFVYANNPAACSHLAAIPDFKPESLDPAMMISSAAIVDQAVCEGAGDAISQSLCVLQKGLGYVASVGARCVN